VSDALAPIFDPGAVASLAEMIGEASAGRLIEIFLGEAVELLGTISSGIAESNEDEAVRAAHSLKSSSATVGALRLSGVSARLEALAQSDQLDAAALVLEDLRQEFDDVRDVLTAESARLIGPPR
jgi:HPt (histidine-containing phosphotransfer) domain-containing protein